MKGYLEGILQAGRGQEVIVRHTRCRAIDGGDSCVFVTSWS
jgi:predicted hydrocarbon binding protein